MLQKDVPRRRETRQKLLGFWDDIRNAFLVLRMLDKVNRTKYVGNRNPRLTHECDIPERNIGEKKKKIVELIWMLT